MSGTFGYELDINKLTAEEKAAEDGSKALITAVYQHVQANPVPVRVKVRGLKSDAQYHLTLEGIGAKRRLPYGFGKDEKITGAASGLFSFEIPFGTAKEAYPQETFVCHTHQITAEYVEKPLNRHNLSENPLDVREENEVYPHCTASVETRGESVFAARNTIDGLIITSGHGFWPHTSWGDGEDSNAEIMISFGRKVLAEEVQVFLRSDFPHDNYWQEAVLCFSDGYEEIIHMEKTGACQSFMLQEPRVIEWVKMKNFRKDENDSSPFPALTQWKVYGREM